MKAATGAGPTTERSKLYGEFWEKFLNRIASEHPGWTTAKASTPWNWYDLPTGVSGVVYQTIFGPQGLRIQLTFGASDADVNMKRFKALQAMKVEFEQALGQMAEWDDKPEKKAAAVYVQSEFKDVLSVDEWPAMLYWVMDRQVKFRQAVEAVGGMQSFA